MAITYMIRTGSGKTYSRPGTATGTYRSRDRAERDMRVLDRAGFGPCMLDFAPRGYRVSGAGTFPPSRRK